MATIAEIKNELIAQIMEIDDIDFLVDFSKFVAYSMNSIEPIKLSKYQKLMIEMGLDDIKNGRVISHEEVMKKTSEWLKDK